MSLQGFLISFQDIIADKTPNLFFVGILTESLVAAEPVGAATVTEAYQGLSVSNQSDSGSDDF